MGSHRRRIAFVCLAVLFCLASIFAPGSRTFASNLASKLGHLRPAAPAQPLSRCGPIPFILNPTPNKTKASPAPLSKTHQPKGRPKDAKAKASTPKTQSPAVDPTRDRR